IMPETDMAVATIVAERLRRRIASESFAIQQGSGSIDVTISIGLATLDAASDSAAAILKRADQALYPAQRDGPNRLAAGAVCVPGSLGSKIAFGSERDGCARNFACDRSLVPRHVGKSYDGDRSHDSDKNSAGGCSGGRADSAGLCAIDAGWPGRPQGQ